MIKLKEIPEPALIKKKSKALAVLDAILCQEWELRYFSHNSKWSEIYEMGSMRDGEGDDYFILFYNSGAAIKGNHRENCGIGSDGLAIDGYKFPDELYADFINESAFSIDEATFILWFDLAEKKWKKMDELKDGEYLGGGADYLLQWLCKDAEFYKNWAEKYYEKIIDIKLVKDIFEFKPLDVNTLKAMGLDLEEKNLYEDLDEIGYPYIENIA